MIILPLLFDAVYSLYIAYRLYYSFFKKFKTYVIIPIIILAANSSLIVTAVSVLTDVTIPGTLKFITMFIFAIFIYIFMIYLITDIFKIIFKLIHKPFISNKLQGVMVVSLSAVICIFGYFNSHNTKIREYTMITDKNISPPIKIAALADIHIGSDMTQKRLAQQIDRINAANPDIIFIAGDIIDSNANEFTPEYINTFKKLYAPLGVYVVFGNHDYYCGNKEKVLSLFNQAGFKTLVDEAAYVPEKDFYIIGRNYVNQHSKSNRMDIEKLAENIDKDKLIIILDHAPFSLDDGKKISADVQISGHTHNGQFFPVNLIVKNMYEIAHGMKNYDGFHVFVTSGLGLWGPPIRVGTDSEIMVINVLNK